MFDLKLCFLDLMRITANGKQKRTPKEMPTSRLHPQYMHSRYNDMNRIYLNENISMTSRCSTIKFSRCPTGNFNPNAMNNNNNNNHSRSSKQYQPLYEWIDPNGIKQSLSPSPLGKTYCRFDSLNESSHLPNISNRSNSDFYVDNNSSSSDENRIASSTFVKGMSSFNDSPLSDDLSLRETETDDCHCSYSDCDQTIIDAHSVNGVGLDSFCTLCTSSFSFNRCNHCEDSSCGSKCNDRNDNNDQKLIDTNNDGGGECTSSTTGGASSSDCESIRFR